MNIRERIERLDTLGSALQDADEAGRDILDAGTQYIEELEDFFGDDPEGFLKWFRENVRAA